MLLNPDVQPVATPPPCWIDMDGWLLCSVHTELVYPPLRPSHIQHHIPIIGLTITTRHRASTSMYSVTFCVRVMSPERHHWKPEVQAAAVMLRTPPRRRPVTG